MEMGKSIDSNLAVFIGQVRSFYLATASAEGQPYIQHRGGPPGFLNVIDQQTLGFADFKGNRQYISTGNLSENPKAFMFLMDYANRRRIKIWGSARIIDKDMELQHRMMPKNYAAKVEQTIIFDVEAWDANCPQHIPQMFFAEDVIEAINKGDARIEALETQIAALRGA